MSGHNAALSLPPGDREDPPAILPDAGSDSDAGREAATGGGNPDLDAHLKRVAAVLDEAQLQLGELRLALGRGDWPAAEAASWRLREALMVDLRALGAEAQRAIVRLRRERLHQEVSP